MFYLNHSKIFGVFNLFTKNLKGFLNAVYNSIK